MAESHVGGLNPAELPPLPGNPLILAREEHSISRKNIDPDALKVMGRLIRHGYRAFLVGGGVRDLLLGRLPKDFDIGTDAKPEQVRALFRNSRIIGRRFRLNHVFFGGNKIYEVSTFRAEATEEEGEPDGHARADNTFGDPESDARRRDLTINGLFYDLSTFSVIDYVGGIADLKNGIIRIIGEPERRFREDPVRMIRAVRHAARTGFEIEPKTLQAICDNNELIKSASPARVFEEFSREIQGGYAAQSLQILQKTGLLAHLIPSISKAMSASPEAAAHVHEVLQRIDRYIRQGTEIPMSVVFLSITIGLLSDEELSGLIREGSIGEYFAMIPGAAHVLETPAEVEPEPEEGNRRHGYHGRRNSPPSVTKLSEAIESLFQPIGVPRKDRERMVSALRVRYDLYRSFFQSRRENNLFGRKGFDDAMFLLELVRGGETAESCLRFWIADDDVESITQSPAPERRKRRRRRRRRRRDDNSDGGADEGGGTPQANGEGF